MSHHGFDESPFYNKQGLMLRALFKAQDKYKAEDIFPDGKLNKEDEGVLAFSVGVEAGKVVLHFAEPTAWMGMTPDQAAELANTLLKHARAAGLTKPVTISL